MKSNGIGTWLALASLALAEGAAAAGPQLAPASEHRMDTLVVTGTGWHDPVAETAPAITVIDEETLDRTEVVTVGDALRAVPGLIVSQSGSRGGTTQIFLRGADPDQVLVLIDGMEVNGTTSGSFDFANLTAENVERIEVLRGYGGTRYGSQAIGGVIHVITKKGEGAPHVSISAAGGNFGTDREVATFRGRTGILSWSWGVSHIRTDGFEDENDDYENVELSARLDADLIEEGTARATVRYGSSELGNFFSNNFLGAPDPDARQENDFLTTRGEWSHSPVEALRYRFGVGYSRDDFSFTDRPDEAETSSTDSEILSEIVTIDGESSLEWLERRARSIFGIEYETRSGDVESRFSDPAFGTFDDRFDETIDNVAGYTLQQFFFLERRLVMSAGVRVDDNERFGTETSPSGSASFLVREGTRLRATYAEGFKAPSLNELFFPGFGNADLDPETSEEVTVGIDQDIGRLRAGASWFRREVDDLIQGVPQADTGLLLAENVGDATFEGVELAFDLDVIEGVTLGGTYTYLDVDADGAVVRRPEHSGSVHAALSRHGIRTDGDRLALDVRLLLVGARDDFDPALGFDVRENDAYQRTDLSASYELPLGGRILKSLRVFTRVENLFDRDYDEALGFPAPPVNFLAGLRVEI